MGPRTIGMAGAMGVLAAGLVSGLLAAPGDAATGERERGPRWQPAGETIVAVEGDADNGFTIHHHDGTTLSPPTLSESTAECSEYDTEVQVVACQAETETWFRDLAATRAAIAWARYDASRPRPGT